MDCVGASIPMTRVVAKASSVAVRGAIALVLTMTCAPAIAWAQLPPFLPNSTYATEAREKVPHWLEVPRTARLSLGDGVTFVPVENAAVSFENLKLGILVGALRNDGACASRLQARLQYVDAQWQPLGPPIPNDARVSQVEPGGLFPYRFRLRTIDDMPQPPAAYVIVLERDDAPMANPFRWDRWVSASATAPAPTPCAAVPTAFDVEVTRRQPLRQGFMLEGVATITRGLVRPDGLVLTAVVRDARGRILEVLVGTPRTERGSDPGVPMGAGTARRFRMTSDIPIGHDAGPIDVYVEVLPEATLGDGRPGGER